MSFKFECGHRNYGTEEWPASVYEDCPTCKEFYCAHCNYDVHYCYGCGEYRSHAEQVQNGPDPHNCTED